MGLGDGAEVCELVDLFLIHEATKVEKILPKESFGTYRDDFLGSTGTNRFSYESTKKKWVQFIAKHGLKIKIEMNKSEVNYLDTPTNLKEGSYKPYMKPNSHLKCVNKISNHWKINLKQIAGRIGTRINTISSSKQHFDEAKQAYQRALEVAGYNYALKRQEKLGNLGGAQGEKGRCTCAGLFLRIACQSKIELAENTSD